MSELSPETKADLHRQLVRLGDMMGDGMHLEPGGKQIARDYGKVLRALGIKPRTSLRDKSSIDKVMALRVAEVPCGKCSGALKQTRKGSTVGKCQNCGARYRLLKVTRGKT